MKGFKKIMIGKYSIFVQDRHYVLIEISQNGNRATKMRLPKREEQLYNK